MINIITLKNRETINTTYKHIKYMEFPWSIFNIVSSALYKYGENKEVCRVIQEVEGCGTINEKTFISKFNGVPLQLLSLSTGSQVILCIYYLIKLDKAKDKIIDITDCGSNAIKYILKYYGNYDLTLYLGHYELYKDMECNFLINGVPATHLYDINKL